MSNRVLPEEPESLKVNGITYRNAELVGTEAWAGGMLVKWEVDTMSVPSQQVVDRLDDKIRKQVRQDFYALADDSETFGYEEVDGFIDRIDERRGSWVEYLFGSNDTLEEQARVWMPEPEVQAFREVVNDIKDSVREDRTEITVPYENIELITS